MKELKMCFYVIIMIVATAVSSCSSKNTQSDQEVKAMDSISSDLEASNKELDAKTEKVEASLEKIDKEFNTSN